MSVLLLSRKLTDVIQNGKTRQVEKLLKQGADPNQLQPEGVSPFHYAVGQQDDRNPELTRLMLEYGGDPNIRSSEGMTPLHVAATWGHAECLRLLLLNGGDTGAKDQDGLDSLDLASQYENSECVELILDFMREAEDDCCKYTMVPYDDRESVAYLMKEEGSQINGSGCQIVRPPRRDTAVYTEHINNLLSSYLLKDEMDGNLIFDVTSPSHPYLESRDLQRLRPSLEKHRRSAESRGDETGSSEESFVTCASVDAAEISQNSLGQGRVSTSPKKSFFSRSFNPMMTSSPPVSICGEGRTPTGQKTWSERSRLRELCNDSGFDATHTYESCSTGDGVSCNHHCHMGCNINQNCCYSPRSCLQKDSVSRSCCLNHATGFESALCRHSSCQSAHCRHSDCQSAHCRHPSCKSHAHPHDNYTCSNPSHSSQNCSNHCSKSLHKSYSKPNDIESSRNSRPSSSATSLVDKFTTISLQDDRNSDKSSLFSHISVSPPLENGGEVVCKNSEMKETSNQSGSEFLPKNSQKGTNSPLDSDTDSLADFIPRDFNMSDLTINSNNSNKRQGGYTIGAVRISPVNRDRTSIESALSTASTIDYVYVDPEEGITLIERHCPSVCSAGSVQTSPDSAHSSRTEDLNVSDDATVLYDWQNYGQTTPGNTRQEKDTESTNSCRTGDSERTLVNTPSATSSVTLTSPVTPDIPPLLKRLSNQQLKSRLQRLGDEPGPVTSSTRQTYLVRLADLENNPNLSRIAITPDKPGFSPELRKALCDQFSYTGLEDLETRMVEAFQKPNPDRKWREGILKSSFNYLLLDPRIAQNLPARSHSLGDLEVFKVFISSIFYVGKGKRSRPYCHLYEAIKHRNSPKNKKPSQKVQKILDIWQEGSGVISLHIFQNVIPVEAYTREACMVDAIGLSVLTNKKRGDYYGVSSTWMASQRRQVGVWLLRKALRIFLAEGERQISPPDIGVGQ